ncbi:tetratricopeptide repeat protein 1-like isoform X1 [Varroa destructor]|uniref:Tetratricopeptide repeat protein 1 n=2 Tax=Varroa destructor TaxID=109461 RepID=A0A7M7KBV1_VARDE|nr:tetratricopeptide repeat protein 1-like isoform X1 [Varroa destructor]
MYRDTRRIMADSKKLEDPQEITDEMKEKLLLNLFNDSVEGKVDQSTQPGTENNHNSVDSHDFLSGNAMSSSEDGDQSIQTRSKRNTGTKFESEPNPNEQSKPPTNPIAEFEEELKTTEEGLSEEQLKDRHKRSQQIKGDANNLYKNGLYGDAAAKYSEALELCPLREEKLRSVLLANKAAALMGQSNNKEALPYLNRALELDPDYLKALERRARLNKILDNLDDALRDYEKLLEMKPKHYDYISNARELRERIHVRNEEMKRNMIDMLKQLGNVCLRPFGLSTDNFTMVPNENGGYNLQMSGKHQQ